MQLVCKLNKIINKLQKELPGTDFSFLVYYRGQIAQGNKLPINVREIILASYELLEIVKDIEEDNK